MNNDRAAAHRESREPTAWNGADDEPLDLVFIDGLVVSTVIGIDDSELIVPQTVVVDLVLGRRSACAGTTDAISDTIDYGVLRQRLHRLMAEHRTSLLEALAEQIAVIAIDEFGADRVRVRVAKPRKFDDVDAVGVQIERRRGQRKSVAQAGAGNVLRLIGRGMFPGPHER